MSENSRRMARADANARLMQDVACFTMIGPLLPNFAFKRETYQITESKLYNNTLAR